jgi:LysM repeat protein/predicted esterase
MLRRTARLLGILAFVLLSAQSVLTAQRIHTVVNGQTLGAIARRYGVSVDELREANQLPSGVRLKVGQRLLVPSPGEVARTKRSLAHAGAIESPAVAADALPSAASGEGAERTSDAPTGANSSGESNPKSDGNSDAKADPGAPQKSESSRTVDALPEPNAPEVFPDEPDPAPSHRVEPPKRTMPAPSVETPNNGHRKSRVDTHRTHTVAEGHTLGKIAKRYHIKVESLCSANGIRRNERLKLGQELVIPNGDDDPIVESGPPMSEDRDTGEHRAERDSSGVKELSVPGAGPVYYYEPVGNGRMSMRPIVVYLHGRGGDAQADCRRWSRVARRFGWLLCPSGPTPHNAGRTWNNNWVSGQHAVMGAIQALRNQYGRRVQLYGNTLVGFSEGAYVAMNVGVRQPRTFNRWLILGADVSYWGGSGLEALKDAKSKVRRVVLITGGLDMVVDDTRTVAGWLDKEGVPLRIQTPGTLAHEVALERMPSMYESALRWLDKGVEHTGSTQARRH